MCSKILYTTTSEKEGNMKRLVVLAIAISHVCGATILRVPSEYTTIQDGLSAANGGDTVLVAPGVYNEVIAFQTNGTKLISEKGPDSTEIHGYGDVVGATSGIGLTTLIQGFKITGGSGGLAGEGGGLRLWGADMTIRGNIFTENVANEGGGLYLERSSAIVESCLIYGNEAEHRGTPGGAGGGIYMFADFKEGEEEKHNTIIRYNTIINNIANAGASSYCDNGGGGIMCCKIGGIEIYGNLIEGNTCNGPVINGPEGAGGIAINGMGGCNPQITDNTIINNDSIGIHIAYGISIGTKINDNWISGHTSYGAMNGAHVQIKNIDCKNNCWGDGSGPYHSTNPSGLGDAVSDHVIFDPWDPCTVGVHEFPRVQEPPFTLSHNWPNPFVYRTTFRLDTRYWVIVSALVYDITGRIVQRVMGKSHKSAGTYEIAWDGTDDQGNRVPPGMYFYRITVNGKSKTHKTILLR
jgi:hypothetical protein